jgi:tRNA threonylcarbamoyladenosine biosynthesis protein TsaE
VITCTCPDPDATKKVAASIAPLLQPGDVVLLDGDLGAGKTTFAQGLAEALGVEEAVTSPTFTLVRVYDTTAGFPLCHVDVYRLERLSEVVELAIPEMLDDGAVAVVEWGKRAAAALPPEYLEVTLDVTGDEEERRLTLNPVGPSWQARMETQ